MKGKDRLPGWAWDIWEWTGVQLLEQLQSCCLKGPHTETEGFLVTHSQAGDTTFDWKTDLLWLISWTCSPSTNNPNPNGGPEWGTFPACLWKFWQLRAQHHPPTVLLGRGCWASCPFTLTKPAFFALQSTSLLSTQPRWVKETFHAWELIHFSSKWWKK